MLLIVKAPSPVLAQSAKPVVLRNLAKQIFEIDPYTKKLIREMVETLDSAKDPQGVGLAAPQVGKSLQLFIMKPTSKSKIQVFINPQIELPGGGTAGKNEGVARPEGVPSSARILSEVEGEDIGWGKNETGPRLSKTASAHKDKMLEGCLSLVNIWGEVQRQKEVKLSYVDENGIQKLKIFKGFPAVIVQHEVDHLNGVLFPKRVLEQKGKLYKSHKNEKGEDVFEEIEI